MEFKIREEEFQLPLEDELKLRIQKDEINNCHDIKRLRKELIETSELLISYKHLLSQMIKAHIDFAMQVDDEQFKKG